MQRAIESFRKQPDLLRLEGGIQHYAWGDPETIPTLLGIENPDRRPCAELWLGAHPNLPSTVELDGLRAPLPTLIAAAADEVLGAEDVRVFGAELPYLFKVLAAAKPLSIQAHPDRERARAGFDREEAAGIPLSAPHRNYKDPHPKPELLAALTEFHGLRGFRPLEEIARVLAEVPELRDLGRRFRAEPAALRTLYQRFMTLPQGDVDAILDPLVRRLQQGQAARSFSRSDREYWLLRADREFSRDGHRDRGLLSIYLLNLVRLRPGEALFLPAGVLHAYLEGAGMEIMASSDNVLRGGLTGKHVDVPELLDSVVFEGAPPEVLRGVQGDSPGETFFRTPAREFELRRIELETGRELRTTADHGAQIVIVVEEDPRVRVEAVSVHRTLELERGQALLVPAGLTYRLTASGPAVLFQATVPRPAAP